MKNFLPMIIFTIYTHVCISLILTKLTGFVKKKNLKINEHTNVTLSATLNDVLNLMVIFIINFLFKKIRLTAINIHCMYVFYKQSILLSIYLIARKTTKFKAICR